MPYFRNLAVKIAMEHIPRATDWQDVQDILSNDVRLTAWLHESDDGDTLTQSIIREAEEMLGDKVPY